MDEKENIKINPNLFGTNEKIPDKTDIIYCPAKNIRNKKDKCNNKLFQMLFNQKTGIVTVKCNKCFQTLTEYKLYYMDAEGNTNIEVKNEHTNNNNNNPDINNNNITNSRNDATNSSEKTNERNNEPK
ncbi:MAG: hypothetical protein ABIM64_04115 [candidate division WOR-3 bacterium]